MPEPKTYTEEELKAAVDKAVESTIGELTVERKKTQSLRADLDKLTADVKSSKDAADKAEAEKQRIALEGKGEYEKALETVKAGYAAELSKKDEVINDLKGKLTTYRVDNQILAAAGGAIDPGEIVTLVKSQYSITEKDDGTIDIMRDGKPVFGKDGKAIDLKGLTESYLSEKPHLVKPSGNSGSGVKGNLGNISQEDLSKMNPVERLAYAREHQQSGSQQATKT
jgi:HEPN domain-containing protein